MMLNDITQEGGANRRPKRVGRGHGSGSGKTCGRGHKGCQSRSGGGTRPLHEGGQMPIFRRLPKRGFSNYQFRTEFEIVNVARLEVACKDGETVDIEAFRRLGVVSGRKPLLKVLGDGTLTKKLTVSAHAFSRQAREAIEKAGGVATLIERPNRAKQARAKRGSVRKLKMKRETAAPAAQVAADEVAPPAVPAEEPPAQNDTPNSTG